MIRSASQPRLCLWLSLVFAVALGAASGAEDRTLAHLGTDRTYRLHLPGGKEPERPLALILALHGAFTNGAITEELTQFNPLSDADGGFAVAYPNADPRGGLGIWDFFSPPAPPNEAGRVATGRDDLGFLKALIDALVAEKIADPKRIYVTGLSNGGFMTNRLALDLGDRIAAVGAVAGTMLKVAADLGKPPRPMPLIYFHGGEDKIVGIDGGDFLTKGQHCLSADALCAWWAAKNGAAAEPEHAALPDADPADGCRVQRLSWRSENAPVVFYKVIGGGHTWPGGSDKQPVQLLGKTTRDIEASRLMWDFFKAHRLP